ncbi:MAG: hypothetical protein JO075_02545 [Acidimicrobiia bacterium]|nr:hypothetical protein [Acidimicrobiia bacterium]
MAVTAVTVLGADLFILSQRNVTTPVTLGQALGRLHQAQTGLPPQASTALSGPAPVAALPAAQASTARRSALVGTPKLPPTPTSVAVAAAATHASPAANPYALPAEGVYAYRTTGGESISVAGASHSYPPETYATVRHLGGCQWLNENDVIKEHVDKRTLCSEPGHLLQLEQSREVTFFGKTDGGDYVCAPPETQHDTTEQVGATTVGTCTASDGSAARIEATYLGHEPVQVGGASVDAVHLHLHSTLTGRAQGTADEQFWLLPHSGLVLRWDRSVDTMADAAFGANVHYQEQATFLLESLTPAN